MRSAAKYPGPIRLIDPICCSTAGLPKISNREFQPFRGCVALLEIAASVTPGVSARESWILDELPYGIAQVPNQRLHIWLAL
jgi:hypothetical protein